MSGTLPCKISMKTIPKRGGVGGGRTDTDGQDNDTEIKITVNT